MIRLHDYLTGDFLGPATDEQIAASFAADKNGVVLIDTRSGEVVTPGSWAEQQARQARTLRSVYSS